MSKNLAKKLMYVIVVMAVLAMMIPMAIPVSAAGEELTMKIYDPGTQTWVVDGGTFQGVKEGFNVLGSIVLIEANGEVDNWTLVNNTIGYDNGYNFGPATFVGTPTATQAYVQGQYGEATITAHFVSGPTLTVHKKWGLIDRTVVSANPAQQYVTWNETSKSWSATGTVTDVVYGNFLVNGAPVVMPVQGVTLTWYLISGNKIVDLTPGFAPALKTKFSTIADYPRAQFVQFIDGNDNVWDHANWNGTTVVTSSNAQGSSTVNVAAWFEEVVQIVIVPEYPTDPNRMVTPEIIALNYGTREFEVVPQVRWAGEKIVLEANFGAGLAGKDVNFYLQNQSIGTLEGLTDDHEAATVWTHVDADGIASCILLSNVSGQADVTAALYQNGRNGQVTNQQAFRVYYLNFESITLSDVVGKRAGHNTGLWTPANPYNNNFPAGIATNDTQDPLTLNVSQDALERVQVRGWFVPPQGTQMSTRPEAVIDINGNGEEEDLTDVLAPAGRWVLPDDWAALAGTTNWKERRIHWDIMDSPSDTVLGDAAVGPYKIGSTVVAPVLTEGPFAPALEMMTPLGWQVANVYTATSPAWRYGINTVVPNGALDFWDAPMPPAKIILEIMSGAGYFKDAYKTDIYYTKVGTTVFYTAPFYQALIPAHPAIPPFNNQAGGGYDWNSFDGSHGPYVFWSIINQPYLNAVVPGDAMHPTKIEIYSDNHGEAMAFLNGNYNLDLTPYIGKGGADVPIDTQVATTILQATADYPYMRDYPAIVSNEVEKDWTWGGQILGTDSHDFGTWNGEPIGSTDSAYTKMVLTAGEYQITEGEGDDALGTSNNKVVFVWATDRDGLIGGVLGTKVWWHVSGGAYLAPIVSDRISNFNDITRHMPITNGFITEAYNTMGATNGSILNVERTIAISYMRTPTTYEKKLFHKKWPALYTDATGVAPINYAIAAIDILSGGATTDNTVQMVITGPDYGYTSGGVTYTMGNVIYETNVDFAAAYPIDDPIIAGDANADGVVDAADIALVENIIMGYTTPNINADTNLNGYIDMGDVVKISRIIRGLD